MDTTTLMQFFSNSKFSQYKTFVDDYMKFMVIHSGDDNKAMEKCFEFFVELITRVEYEQKRLDHMQGESKNDKNIKRRPI